MIKKADTATKDKIIEAAYNVLSEQGYDKASMKVIAKEAGVAQGLINYYFPSKEDLLFALFHEESCRYCEEMGKLTEMPINDNYISQAMNGAMALVEQYPEWLRLRFELFAIGLRTGKGCEEIAKSMHLGRELAMSALDKFPLNSKLNKEGIASVIVSVFDGLGLQKMTDPNFDATAAYGALADLLGTYLVVNLEREEEK
jgi:AcrR family transcriptional regulator